jgi:hypothetical protein
LDLANLSTVHGTSNDEHFDGALASATTNAENQNRNNIACNNNSNSSPENEQWDDEALGASLAGTATKKGSQTTTNNVLDMKSIDPKKGSTDTIAEKLRLQETKAQLAAAREGMERQAQKIKESKEKMLETTTATAATGANRFAAASASTKWVPTHMRGAGSSGTQQLRAGGGGKLDVADNELFPDLAAADKILKEKETQKMYKPIKKTPVGGGATWASQKQPVTAAAATTSSSKQAAVVSHTSVSPEPLTTTTATAAVVEEEALKVESVVPVANPVSPAVVAPKLAIKKKKKDLSTFKPKG